MKLKYQIVLLVRTESQKTPLCVLDHEVEVLKVLHGEENVVLTDDKPPVEYTEFNGDGQPTLADEYARLHQYYKGNNEMQDPVGIALGPLAEFEESFEGVDNSGKDELLAKALELGINANKRWGIGKLQAAIDEATAE